MKKRMRALRRDQRGQSATEYMLVIAIVVLGLVAAASKFLPVFSQSVSAMSNRVSNDWLTNNPAFQCPNGGQPPQCI